MLTRSRRCSGGGISGMSTCGGEALSIAGKVRAAVQFRQAPLPPRRIGQRDRAIDAHHAHGEVARLRQALHIQPVQRVDGQTGHLHEGQTEQQHQRGARRQTARPKAKFHARCRSRAGAPIL